SGQPTRRPTCPSILPAQCFLEPGGRTTPRLRSPALPQRTGSPDAAHPLPGHVYINEQAREKLKALWPAAYESNMRRLIPVFAMQLNEGEIPINGVKQLPM